jgi:group I intron endonuclease
MKSGIYQFRSLLNGRLYIGSTVNFNKRQKLHLHYLRKNAHHAKVLQRHFNKYGEKDLIFEIIEQCEISVLIQREQYYFDTITPYFNSCKVAGNTSGWKHSDETKATFSAIHKGKTISIEMRNAISIANKGKVDTFETRKRKSDSLKGYVKSAEHCKNISLALTGKNIPLDRVQRQSNSSSRFYVVQYDLKDNYIQTFDSSYIASNMLNIPKKPIQRVCRGIYKSTHNFKFKYIDKKRST